jgi:hypothetical protein
MNSLYRPLNIPVAFLKNNFNKTKYSTSRHQLFDQTDISDSFFEWLHSLGIILDHAEVFFSVPGQEYLIHKDQHTLDDFPKINWVYGDLTSNMNWFNPIHNGTISNTAISTPFVGYSPQDVELLFSTSILSPSLVQAGVPHNVSNIKSVRWCVSTVYSYPNKKLIPWDEMTTILKPYI